MVCFLVKLVFILVFLVFRILEHKLALMGIVDLSINIKAAQFGVIATAEIFASPNLRQKFLAIFGQK